LSWQLPVAKSIHWILYQIGEGFKGIFGEAPAWWHKRRAWVARERHDKFAVITGRVPVIHVLLSIFG